MGKNGLIKELSEVDGEIFVSSKDVKKVLCERVVKTIEKMVFTAEKLSQEWFMKEDVLLDNNHDDDGESVDEGIYSKNIHSENTQIDCDLCGSSNEKHLPSCDLYITNDSVQEAQLIRMPDGTMAKINIKIPENFDIK